MSVRRAALLSIVVVVLGDLCYLNLRQGLRTIKPVRFYNAFPGGMNGPKIQLKGNFIKENGFCVEVWLQDRIDTVICPNLVITEAEPTSGQPADSSVVPVIR